MLSVEVLNFFQASLRNCINWVHCDEHFFIFISFPQFIYDLFHISLTLISFMGTYEPTIYLLPVSVAGGGGAVKGMVFKQFTQQFTQQFTLG